MEFVDGQSLDAMGTLEVGPGVLIFHELAAVLAHMHRRGVIHGDLKPGHVLLSKTGQVKTLGYGRTWSRTPPPTGRGTPEHMAPEQLKAGTVDERTDLYNLGATIYHIMTGRPANTGSRAMGEGGKIPLPTALNSKIPTKLNNLIVACLQSNPDQPPRVRLQRRAGGQGPGRRDEPRPVPATGPRPGAEGLSGPARTSCRVGGVFGTHHAGDHGTHHVGDQAGGFRGLHPPDSILSRGRGHSSERTKLHA